MPKTSEEYPIHVEYTLEVGALPTEGGGNWGIVQRRTTQWLPEEMRGVLAELRDLHFRFRRGDERVVNCIRQIRIERYLVDAIPSEGPSGTIGLEVGVRIGATRP